MSLERAKKIVKNHFSLMDESYNRFANLVDGRNNIPENLKDLFDENKRAFFPITDLSIMESIDEGWKIFKNYFPVYKEKYKVKYSNYAENKLSLQGSPKLVKHLMKNQIDISSNELMHRIITKIVQNKISSKNLNLVLSLNFEDWLLCSTGETWTSCYDLESNYEMCYWSGIPGIYADPDRILAFITNKEEKEYCGIYSYKMISRCFIQLTKNDLYKTIRGYPNSVIENLLPEILKDKMSFEKENLSTSKNCFSPLFFNNKYMCLPYTDGGYYKYNKEDKTLIFIFAESTFASYSEEGEEAYDPFICYSDGLEKLIENEEEIKKYMGETMVCAWCGSMYFEEDMHEINNGDFFCSSCYYEKIKQCCCCCEDFELDDLKDINGYLYCQSCYEENISVCDHCKEKFDSTSLLEKDDKFYCEDCFDKLYETCDYCGEDFLKTDKHHLVCQERENEGSQSA